MMMMMMTCSKDVTGFGIKNPAKRLKVTKKIAWRTAATMKVGVMDMRNIAR